MKLREKRQQLDLIDNSLVNLLVERTRVVKEIGEYKKENNLERTNPDREREILDQQRELAERCNLNIDLVGIIFESIFSDAHKIQRKIIEGEMSSELENLINELTDVRLMKPIPIPTPREIKERYPLTERAGQTVLKSRKIIQDILDKNSKKLLIVTGPCSIDDSKATLEYAEHVKKWNQKYEDIFFVMRTYFEKPRSQLGWKGFLLDPDLDESYNIEKGHYEARRLLLKINEIGVSCGTEFLGLLTPQYYDDLISWAAIGARTVESQPHREMASGLSMPVGMKNNTEGNIKSAIDAIKSANSPHWFVGGSLDREYTILPTKGNPYAHIILRGGNGTPNYTKEFVKKTKELLEKEGVPKNIIIDCSHANSGKDYTKQPEVALNTINQRAAGNLDIVGIMLESYLIDGKGNQYGQSKTDQCMGLEMTEKLIKDINAKI